MFVNLFFVSVGSQDHNISWTLSNFDCLELSVWNMQLIFVESHLVVGVFREYLAHVPDPSDGYQQGIQFNLIKQFFHSNSKLSC